MARLKRPPILRESSPSDPVDRGRERSTSPAPLSLTTLAIRRATGTFVLAIAVVVLGLFVISRMPVDLLPSITYPRIGLRLSVPGVVPSVAVNDITRPLEEAMSATEGVEQIFSRTREGRISISLFFRPGEDIDRALNEATTALNRVRDRLPDAAGEPRLFKADPSQAPVYELALTSEILSLLDLRIFADEELTRELTRVPGVANVDVSGGVREEMQVNLDLDRLQGVGLDVGDVLNALGDRNQDTAGGFIRGGAVESLARVAGRFQRADEIRRLPLPSGQGRGPIYLEDVATINDGIEEQRVFVSLNGLPAVKVTIQKQPDANSIAVVEGIKAKLEDLREAGLVTEDMTLQVLLDESEFIRASIADVVQAGFMGALLAGLVVLLFLGSLRQTLVIVLAIPLATLVAMTLMGLFGLSLNVFSLGGLALGVGIVVDNTIVMLEAIATADPEDPNGSPLIQSIQERAETRSRDLESALLASTATNLVSVLPFLMLGGFISLVFGELILTVSFAVAASLPIALTVVPALAVKVLSIRRSSGISRWGLIRRFQWAIATLTKLYRHTLSVLLRYRLITLGFTITLLITSSLWMVVQLPQEILPSVGTGRLSLSVRFPPGTPLADNRRVMAEIDRLFLAQPEVTSIFTTAGGALFAGNTSANALRGRGTITVQPGTNVDALSDRLEALAQDEIPLVGVRIFVFADRLRGLSLRNSPTRGELDLVLQSTDPDALETAKNIIRPALAKQAKLARYRPSGGSSQQEVRIFPDWQRAADLNLSARDIGATVETALSGSVPTLFQRNDRLINVRVQLKPGTINQPDLLRDLPLFTNDNQRVRLGDIATVGTGNALGEIQRINQRQVLIFNGSLADGANLSDAIAENRAIINSLDLPEGVTLLPSTSAEANQALQRSLQILGGLATFAVFVVMVVQYNSLRDPLIILLTVPLAAAGGILGLYVTETALGATVLIGIVLLIGIVVNNAIVLVERANQIRDRESLTPRTAILQASTQRLRPILMTTITTVLGLLPLAVKEGGGAALLQPLGVVVFSGLSLATLLTLFIVPCFYTLFHRDRTQPQKF